MRKTMRNGIATTQNKNEKMKRKCKTKQLALLKRNKKFDMLIFSCEKSIELIRLHSDNR